MKALTIAARELRAYFVSPLAYVVLTVWLLWTGATFYYFCTWFASNPSGSETYTPLTMFFSGNMLLFLPMLVFVPVLTMRLLAEEAHSGTLEQLLTVPVSDTAIVLGKYLAAMVMWCTLWVPTLVYVLITTSYGTIDPGTIVSSYVGLLGIGLYYMAIGLLMSALASTQVVAAVLTFLFLGMLFLLGIGQFIFPGPPAEVLAYLSVWGHMTDFAKGIVDTRYLVYDASLTALALFFAVQAIDVRRDG
ncbi:MAG: ABC transporter permease subunit [Myxococcales bacterium]|nr:ABC transporter permease subunit [Myxococcales bacterium]